MKPQFAIVTTTVESQSAAAAMARALVEARLAACVHLAPVRSIYTWQGAIEEAEEVRLSCKIAAEDFPQVRAAIESRHAYDVPEIVMTLIEDGAEAYLAWLGAETRSGRSDTRKP